MKKIVGVFLLMLFIAPLFAENVLVLDFDTEIRDYENNAIIMSDMIRSELVRTGKVNVVDKKSMNVAIEEIQNQQSEYRTNENVKQLGRMLNADYLVIGHVMTLSNKSAGAVDSGNLFLDSAEKVLTGKDKVEVIVQLLDIETLHVLSSSSAEMKKWTDFSKYTKKIAVELTSAVVRKNSATEKVLTNINNATEDLLVGTWTSEVVHDGIIDTYTITFGGNRKIDLSVTSSSKKNKITQAEGSGRYTFNDSEKILSVTINTLKGDVKHLDSIKWKTFVNPASDDSMFSCSIPVSSVKGAKNMRADFYKDD